MRCRWPGSGSRRGCSVHSAGVCGAALAWFPMPDDAVGAHWLASALAGAGLAAALFQWLRLRAQATLPAETAARLAELQSRIRPHFLFNTLNTALTLVRLDPVRAEGLLEDLAELFRVALTETGTEVTLDEEVELARRYLAIEQIRFGERLKVSWELDEAAGAARVPPLLLQPLVENAVRHGVEPSAEGGAIRVRTRVTLGRAVVSIVNTVPEAGSRPGNGMALHNVREPVALDARCGSQLRDPRRGWNVQGADRLALVDAWARGRWHRGDAGGGVVMSLRVLLVDDEELARFRLRGLVSECPSPQASVVGEAASVPQALVWLAQHRCDVVLLDIAMPGRDGTQLADELRTRADAPAVVFVTAHAQHALKAFDLDAVDYLTKPVRRRTPAGCLAAGGTAAWPSLPPSPARRPKSSPSSSSATAAVWCACR